MSTDTAPTATWFYLRQNNSGGYYHIDESRGIGYIVAIEAESEQEMEQKAEKIGLLDLDFCECCGPRFATWWNNSGACARPGYIVFHHHRSGEIRREVAVEETYFGDWVEE